MKGVANVPTGSSFRFPGRRHLCRRRGLRTACDRCRVGRRDGEAHRVHPGAAGAGDPYFPLDGNGGYDAEHYLLDLQYDPATDVIGGSATMLARATQNLSRFNLDLEGLTVRSVEVNGRDAAWRRDGGELVITPSKGIREREHFLTQVVYSGFPRRSSTPSASAASSTPTMAL